MDIMNRLEIFRTILNRSITIAAPLFIFCFLLMPLGLYADEAITLEHALNIALKKSPSLGSRRSDVDAADARLTQSKSAYYPQLNATAGYDHTWSDSTGGAGIGASGGGSSGDSGDYSTGLTVNQYLFDFGKTPAQVETSRQNLESTRKSYEISEKTLIRDIKQAYFEVLKNHQLVIVSKENVAFQKQQLAQARALYKEGMRPKIDVTRAEVQISQAELKLLNDTFTLRRSIIAFEKLLGGPPVPGPYSLAEANPGLQPPPALDPLVDQAVSRRPEFMRIQAQIKSAEAGLLSAKRSAYPSLSARGSYSNSGESFPLEDERWQAGVNLNWPLFTGFRKTGQIAESTADINGLNAQLDSLKLSVTEEVTRAFLLVQANTEAIKTSEVALRQAKENLDMAEGRYKTGVSDALELSDAQVLYTESRSSLVQSVYEQYKALAELEFSVGGDL
jgi:TolC family type I secretion outer membrane protein